MPQIVLSNDVNFQTIRFHIFFQYVQTLFTGDPIQVGRMDLDPIHSFEGSLHGTGSKSVCVYTGLYWIYLDSMSF